MSETTMNAMQNAMRLSQITSALLTMFESDKMRMHSVLMLGPSGIGKSQMSSQLSAALDVPFIDIRLSQWDAVDARGIPTAQNGKTVWCPPSLLPETDKGILLFDEVTSAPPSVQAVAYQAMLDRRIGDMRIPKGWMVLAAGNLQSDRGITHTLAAPLINRMVVFYVAPHVDDVTMHFASIGVDYRVIAFLRIRPDLLHKFEGAKYTSGSQFPTPRGWERVSDALGVGFSDDILHATVIGSVGAEAGSAFMGFVNDAAGLVSMEEILRDPKGCIVPPEMHKQYALAMGLASRMDKFTYDAGYEYLKRLSKDIQMLAATIAYHKNKDDFKRATMFKDFSRDIVAINKL